MEWGQETLNLANLLKKVYPKTGGFMGRKGFFQIIIIFFQIIIIIILALILAFLVSFIWKYRIPSKYRIWLKERVQIMEDWLFEKSQAPTPTLQPK